jgi:hypothetical protein
MAVLQLLTGTVIVGYVGPKLANFLYEYGMSGPGAVALLWGGIALVYDFAFNMDADDGFSNFDAGVTLAAAILIRALTG